MARWWGRSPSSNVTRVRFRPGPVSYVDWVVIPFRFVSRVFPIFTVFTIYLLQGIMFVKRSGLVASLSPLNVRHTMVIFFFSCTFSFITVFNSIRILLKTWTASSAKPFSCWPFLHELCQSIKRTRNHTQTKCGPNEVKRYVKWSQSCIFWMLAALWRSCAFRKAWYVIAIPDRCETNEPKIKSYKKCHIISMIGVHLQCCSQ